ncbi:MAG: hypothetical protein QOD99_1479 [Chthoniobacter sp.]|jgi:hypothetical protein|nr:hypothetical protein [Chthoniobacter sp.]
MKLGKEEIKKITLSLMVLTGVLYCYTTMLLGPLARSEAASQGKIKTIEPQIAEAKKQLQKTSAVEARAPVAAAALEEIKASIPEGAPVAWFPPRITEFFKRAGIEKTQARFVKEETEKELTGFRKMIWNIEVPRAEFGVLGAAIAALENEEPLLEVTTVTVDALKDEPQFQHATLIVSTLGK